MDLKLVITNCGEERLYSSLSHELERRLPLSTVAWKRSMGKATRTVSLSAIFERFKPSALQRSNTNGQNLYSQPFFHIFWTSCLENDEYKSKLKDSIGNWIGKLRNAEVSDWLIVHVMYQDPVKANKAKMLLPRSSVYDKIKNDFCNKNQDRCLQLWEPDKETLFTKSRESWNFLVLHLQQQLLTSFDRRLLEFEDQLRKLLEDHPKPNWPFEQYFMLREELALTMKSIRLYEDSLIHYDQLNAVFAQSVINYYQSGGQPSWLYRYTQPCRSWMGLSFNKATIQRYRKTIRDQSASLLDFRNYLFVRICKLILLMKRAWTIGPRLLEYMYAVVHELRMLKVDVPPGGVALWVVSSCLNILPLLIADDTPSDAQTKVMLAGIYDYGRSKLDELGVLCALMPHTTPDDHSKEMVQMLTKHLQPSSDSVDSDDAPSSCTVLSEALTSKENFQHLYLDMSNRAIALYKEAGRHRFAMVIATKLSKFYLHCGEFDVAEKFLEEALDVYRQQGWEQLYIDVLVPLAQCLEKHDMHDRYLVALAPLSCAVASLSESERTSYAQQFLELARSNDVKRHTINSDPLLTIVDVKIDLLKEIGHIGDRVNVELHLQNNLPVGIPCDLVSIGLRYSSTGTRRNTGEDTFYDRLRTGSDVIEADDLPIVFQKKPNEERDSVKGTNLMARLKNKLQSNSLTRGETASHKPRHSRTRSQPANLNSKVIADIRQDLEKAAGHHTRSNSVDLNATADQADGSKITKMASDTELTRTSLPALEFVGTDTAAEEYDVIASPTDQLASLPSESQERPRLRSHTSYHSLPEIELEPDPVPSQRLTATNVTLVAGLNTITLSDKITHEGRYALQALSCQVGRVQLYHLLVLPRRSKAFFVVNDPPKFTWTPSHSECYLAGNVQRLYFTMSNGPGVIPQESVVRISSTSQLTFCLIPPSSVMVSSHVTGDAPREAVLSVEPVANNSGNMTSAVIRLPACRPYETIHMFADVIAPVHSVSFTSNMAKHKLVFQCGWLEQLTMTKTALPCVFYEPFSVSHQLICSGPRQFIQVTLQGLNPIQLQFDSPTLTCPSCSDIQFQLTNDALDMHLYAGEEFTFVWEMIKSPQETAETQVLPSNFDCTFSIKFKTKDQENFEGGSFSHSISLKNVKALLQIETSLTGEPEGGNVKVIEGHSCPVQFTITYVGKDVPEDSIDLLCFVEDSNHWRFKDELRSQRLTIDRVNGACAVIKTEAAANVVGVLELPSLRLTLVASRHPEINGDVETTDGGPISPTAKEMSFEKGLKRKNRLSSSRRTGSSTSSEETVEFKEGEVASIDVGKMVVVLDRTN